VNNIQDIMKTAKVTESDAFQIEQVIMSEQLLDWSECTQAEFKKAIKISQMFIANGLSWE
jgi:epoxyqueuosine reductase QueG